MIFQDIVGVWTFESIFWIQQFSNQSMGGGGILDLFSLDFSQKVRSVGVLQGGKGRLRS